MVAPAADGQEAARPLAIVCGSGAFPLAVAGAAVAGGRRVFLIGVSGTTDPAIGAYPHGWLRVGQLGRMIALARSAGCREMMFVGGVSRPAGWRDLRFDLGLLRVVPRIAGALRGGDNHLLKAFADAVADAGFAIKGVADVAPQLMLPVGPIGNRAISAAEREDAAFGLEVLNALSPFDIGQGVVVAKRRVLAIEAAEGTDAMLARIRDLRAGGRLRTGGGLFVKAAKLGQDLRLDTPAVGVETVRRVAEAGLSAVAVVGGEVMSADAADMIGAADEAGIALVGLDRTSP